MEEPVCVICERSVNLIEIKEMALNKLIEVSVKRRDFKFKKMKKMSSALIHKFCQKNYIQDTSVTAAQKLIVRKLSEKKQITKDAENFDFTSRCLFCGVICHKHQYKHQVRLVTNKNTKENLLNAVENGKVSGDSREIIVARLNKVEDLVEVKARYHCYCMTHFYAEYPSKNVGCPINITDFTDFLISYIKKNDHECQFSANEIKAKFTQDPNYSFPDISTIKSKLYDHFSNEIICHTIKKDLIILYKNSIGQILDDAWYEKRFKKITDENMRIVKKAAEICLEAIRSTKYDNDFYQMPDSEEESLFNDVPAVLRTFLDIIIKTHKEKSEDNMKNYGKKVATISHCIISATRPRSFSSPILLGLSAMMHKKYASKGLIDSLANVGLCSSYKEVLRFEASIVKDPANHSLLEDAYIQFVYDNADHNTCTIDGKNTFHAMGGIMVATPSSSVVSKKKYRQVEDDPSLRRYWKNRFCRVENF